MKKTLLSAFIFLHAAAFAQDGFFIQPAFGFGNSNYKVSFGKNFSLPSITIPGYDGQLGLCYQKNKIGINTGITYFRTGAALPSTLMDERADPPVQYLYYHVAVPVMVSYRLGIGNKFSLVPAIGVRLSYNLSETDRRGYPGTYYKVPAQTFDVDYNRISIFGAARINLEYKLTRKLSLSAGPEVLYMLSNMLKAPNYNTTQYNYAYIFDLGIKWHVGKNKVPTAQTPTQQN